MSNPAYLHGIDDLFDGSNNGPVPEQFNLGEYQEYKLSSDRVLGRERPQRFASLSDDERQRAALCYFCTDMAVADKPGELPPGWTSQCLPYRSGGSNYEFRYHHVQICPCRHEREIELGARIVLDPSFEACCDTAESLRRIFQGAGRFGPSELPSGRILHGTLDEILLAATQESVIETDR